MFGVNRALAWIRQSGQVGDSGRDTFENKNLIKPNKKVLIENVGVKRAPAWIRQPVRVGDSGRDTFENENLIKR